MLPTCDADDHDSSVCNQYDACEQPGVVCGWRRNDEVCAFCLSDFQPAVVAEAEVFASAEVKDLIARFVDDDPSDESQIDMGRHPDAVTSRTHRPDRAQKSLVGRRDRRALDVRARVRDLPSATNANHQEPRRSSVCRALSSAGLTFPS